MTSYKKVIEDNMKVVESLCHVSGLKRGLVQNIVRFVKCLVEPKSGLIDKNIFTVILLKYFEVVDQNFVQLIFDRSRKINAKSPPRNLSVEEFSRIICVFLSEDVEVKMSYVFNVYDLNGDGEIEPIELIDCIKRCKVVTDADETDMDETFTDLYMLMSQLLGLSTQPAGSGLPWEKFRDYVRQDPLILGIIGQSLPRSEVRKRFINLMTTKTNITIQELFVNIRQELLFEPKPHDQPEYYRIKLDLP